MTDDVNLSGTNFRSFSFERNILMIYKLVNEPYNDFDKKAVKVTLNDQNIGYIPKFLNSSYREETHEIENVKFRFDGRSASITVSLKPLSEEALQIRREEIKEFEIKNAYNMAMSYDPNHAKLKLAAESYNLLTSDEASNMTTEDLLKVVQDYKRGN
jgi:hypothetical protein